MNNHEDMNDGQLPTQADNTHMSGSDHTALEGNHHSRNSSKGHGSFWYGILCGALVMFLAAEVVIPALTGVEGGVSALRRESSSDGSAINRASVRKLKNLEDVIDLYYYEPDQITTQQKEDGLYKGLLESLDDPYSVYYTADEMKQLEESLSGQYYGIGAYLSQDKTSGYPKIAGVIEGTPADQAGLQADDIIYKVDGEDMGGKSLDEVVSLVRGEEGTSVTLTIARSGEDDYLDIVVERAEVDSPTVSSRMLDEDKGIGYIAISEFDEVTTSQFEEELAKLEAWNSETDHTSDTASRDSHSASAGETSDNTDNTDSLNDTGATGSGEAISSRTTGTLHGLVLDLRGNPGGNVDTVTAIANYFLPEGLVFYMEDRDGNRTEYTADGTQQLDIPVAVLVNGNSASASEILSGAIKDAGTGTIIGTTTYGKGVVQTIYSFSDGTAVKITIANYFTRNGNDINKKGVDPDIEVKFDADAYQKDGTDNQLERALQEVQSQL